MHSPAESESGQEKIVTLSPDFLISKLLLEGATHSRHGPDGNALINAHRDVPLSLM